MYDDAVGGDVCTAGVECPSFPQEIFPRFRLIPTQKIAVILLD